MRPGTSSSNTWAQGTAPPSLNFHPCSPTSAICHSYPGYSVQRTFGRFPSSARSRCRPPRPNGALAQNSRVWPTLASWRLGLRVGRWSPPGVPDLSPSFIPIHTASHMLLELAQRAETQGRRKLPAPPLQSHGTLPLACSRLSRPLYTHHAPSPRPHSASPAALKQPASRPAPSQTPLTHYG